MLFRSKANKAYDLVWAPNRPHSLTEPYFIRRRWDYFVQHLLGMAPPENYKITPPEGSQGGGDGNTPDDDDDDPFSWWPDRS